MQGAFSRQWPQNPIHHYRVRSNYTSSQRPQSTRPSPYTSSTPYSPTDRSSPQLNTSVLFEKEHSNTYKLIEDEELRSRYLEVLRKANGSFSDRETISIHSTFSNLIDIHSGFSSPQTLDVLITFWDITFAGVTSELTPLQKRFLEEKDKFIHILINSRRYDVYQKSVRPLYKLHPCLTWADKLITMFELQYVDEKLYINKSAIVKFMRGESDIALKRKVISILIHRGAINSANSQEKHELFKLFIELCEIVGDGHFLFVDPAYNEYARVLRLMAIPQESQLRGISEPMSTTSSHTIFLEHIANIKDFFGESSPVFFKFLTSVMHHIVPFSPNNVLNYWKYKTEYVKSQDSPFALSHHDLKIAMNALATLKLYPEVLQIYKSHPNLHHEDQIEVLLKVSELSKDWKLLQSQFEEMYGKGKLPYVIHYAIVMKALAGIGARDEVDMLFEQLNKRKLVPTASIFIALISSRLHYDDIASAKRSFDLYMKYVNDGVFQRSQSAYLYRLIFTMYIKSKDLEQVKAFLEDTLKQQEETNTSLISTRTINDLIQFAGNNYGLELVERLRELAEKLSLANFQTYKTLIKIYTKLDQYEKANELVFKAHSLSDVPFTDVDVYTAQLKMYRHWIRRIPDPEQRSFYQMKQAFIVNMITSNQSHTISVKKNSNLYAEVIEYFLLKSNVEYAQKVINLTQKRELLREQHFIPFMRYYLRQDTYESYGEILNLYRKMVDQRIDISTRTYVYLMKALIYLDLMNNNSGDNAFKLLKSIFEMNGLTLKPQSLNVPISKAAMIGMFEKAEDLFKIVVAYVTDSGMRQNDIDMLVHFLNQIKKILGGKLSLEFRFLIYKEMSRIYMKQKNFELAESLIDNGIEDLTGIVQNYSKNYPYGGDIEPILPVTLVKDLRNLLKIKAKLLEFGRKGSEEYLSILRSTSEQGVRLSGTQYNKLFKELFRERVSESTLKLILSVCENHLISGNWVEVKLMRKLQFMYKLAMLHLSRGVGNDSTIQKYRILSDYYDVRNLLSLKSELSFIKDPLQSLEYQFEVNKNTLAARMWDCDKIVENIPGFFIPERRIRSENKISPSNCYQIWLALDRFLGEDKLRAFKLMDEFPETLEFLMYNEPARIRLGIFRSRVDKLMPPRNDYQETFGQRYERTETALHKLGDMGEKLME